MASKRRNMFHKNKTQETTEKVLTSDEQDVYKKLEQGFDKIIPMALNLPENTTGSTNMTSRVKTFYFGKEPVTDQKFQQLTDVFTDSLFLHPAVDSLRLHLGVGFFYYFDYLGEWSHADRLHSRRAAKGPAHGDEAIYLFDDKRSFPALRGDDLIMSVKLVKLWTNFAKYGNPIPKNEIWDWGNWNDHRRYMHFGKDGFCLKRNLLSQRNEFWTNMTELYPSVLYDP
ncbi:hypothetical protein AAG570_003771 [Ranatra chinensis]|uniref:Carboxylesterase type B domain-containing protein n=1 Tax=Ranatra chinensis TaxID=642074 RepID=A0ABD0Y4K4_9HEMI